MFLVENFIKHYGLTVTTTAKTFNQIEKLSFKRSQPKQQLQVFVFDLC
ncbi:hypothetical protein C4J99_1569 [Pseudomonas synxantha]|nr:hypothetical protein C4J99_1569 [Pseudomonas synxantha]